MDSIAKQFKSTAMSTTTWKSANSNNEAFFSVMPVLLLQDLYLSRNLCFDIKTETELQEIYLSQFLKMYMQG